MIIVGCAMPPRIVAGKTRQPNNAGSSSNRSLRTRKAATSSTSLSWLRLSLSILPAAFFIYWMITNSNNNINKETNGNNHPHTVGTVHDGSGSIVQPIERIEWSSSYGDLLHFFTSGPHSRPRPVSSSGNNGANNDNGNGVNDLHGVRPIVLTNTIADKWSARKLWTPAYLAKTLGATRLPRVLTSNLTTQFLYANAANPLATSTIDDGFVWQGPPYAVNHNMPANHFFNTLTNGPG
jgi:hypothetical protein